MSNQADARAYRLRQAEKILHLFEAATGHPARTMEELYSWAATPEGQATLAIHRDPKTGTIDPA
jgi:hypothetical protein